MTSQTPTHGRAHTYSQYHPDGNTFKATTNGDSDTYANGNANTQTAAFWKLIRNYSAAKTRHNDFTAKHADEAMPDVQSLLVERRDVTPDTGEV
ncbi:hypothetical protein, partial [Deinococcus rubellus]|uniref:hypothetical protein n=1 Tax=Deinococcus rubellus TaxID=1889240 RepID=UPI0031E70D71